MTPLRSEGVSFYQIYYMPNLKNKTQKEELAKALAGSKAVILADYAGLGVSAQNELRRLVSAAGGRFSIAKNSLLKIVLKEKLGELSEDAVKALEGPTAVLWANEDEVTPTKALIKFADTHDLPQVKLGFLEGRILSAAEVKGLAALPGKQELLGMLVGQLNAPIYSFAQVLRANLQNLVFVVDAIKRSKE